MKRSTRSLPTDYVPARPLWHFGWRGWVMLPALLALLGVTWSGYDLRFQLQSLIARTLGLDAMFSFTAPGLTAHAVDFNWLLNTTRELYPPFTRFGLLPASIITISLAIHPRRYSSRTMVTILVAGFLVPIVHWITPSWTARQLGFSWPLNPGVYSNSFIFGQLIAGTILALLVICISIHSRSLTIFFASWLAFGLLLFVEMHRAGEGSPALLIPLDIEWRLTRALHWTWHACLFIVMLTWSIRARLHHLPPHACQHCAYDLRGLPSSATLCPECGQPTPNARIHAHDEPAGASRGAGSSLVFAPTPSTNPNEKTGEPQGPPVQSSIITQTARENASRP